MENNFNEADAYWASTWEGRYVGISCSGGSFIYGTLTGTGTKQFQLTNPGDVTFIFTKHISAIKFTEEI